MFLYKVNELALVTNYPVGQINLIPSHYLGQWKLPEKPGKLWDHIASLWIAFTNQIGQDKKELWSSKLKRLLNLAGLGDIWSAKTNTPAVMNYIRQRLLDIHNDERKDPHQKKQTKNF